MDNPKIDTELQLSLELTQEEREKSLDLSVGYDVEFEEWEVIVKYSGDLTVIQEELGASVTPMINEYAILRIRENQMERLAAYPQIEFIEKPKSLILEEMEGIRASCINPVRLPPLSLYPPHNRNILPTRHKDVPSYYQKEPLCGRLLPYIPHPPFSRKCVPKLLPDNRAHSHPSDFFDRLLSDYRMHHKTSYPHNGIHLNSKE